MHKLMNLRDTLVTELEEYGNGEQLDMAALDVIDKLAHAIKNIDKVINADCCDDYDRGYDYYDRGTYAKRGRISGLRHSQNDRSREESKSQRYE